MIFELCKFAWVPVWYGDVLKTWTKLVDIFLIRDEANELAPNKGPRAKVQPQGESFAAMVDQTQGADEDK